MNQQPACRLFLLPPELRINIYELVFAAIPTPSRLASAYTCTPPRQLLLTCKRTREDASEVYAQAFRTYWKSSTFSVVHREVTYDWTHLLGLIGDTNIERMAKVIVIPRPTLPGVPSTRRKLVLQHANSDTLGWTIEIGGIRVGSAPPRGIGLSTRVADQVAEITWMHQQFHPGMPGLKHKLLKAVLLEAGRV